LHVEFIDAADLIVFVFVTISVTSLYPLSCANETRPFLQTTVAQGTIGFVHSMNKNRDVINWYHCQSLMVGMISLICIPYYVPVKLMLSSRRHWLKAIL
jgi:hypothetical protein